MDEGEWLATTDVLRLLEHIWRSASESALWNFASACYRRLALSSSAPPDLINDVRKRLDWIEGGGACYFLLPTTRPMADLAFAAVHEAGQYLTTEPERVALSDLARDVFGNPLRPIAFDPVWRSERVHSVAFAADEERRLPSGELDPDRLLILADALEDAGCCEPTILRHLRGFRACPRCEGTGRSPYDLGYYPPPREPCPDCDATGWLPSAAPHVRGCHVVDACLGKG